MLNYLILLIRTSSYKLTGLIVLVILLASLTSTLIATRLLKVEVVVISIDSYTGLISSHSTVIAITEVVAMIAISLIPQSVLIETIFIIKWFIIIIVSLNV